LLKVELKKIDGLPEISMFKVGVLTSPSTYLHFELKHFDFEYN
jgi:hypothetical protein